MAGPPCQPKLANSQKPILSLMVKPQVRHYAADYSHGFWSIEFFDFANDFPQLRRSSFVLKPTQKRRSDEALLQVPFQQVACWLGTGLKVTKHFGLALRSTQNVASTDTCL